MKKNYRMNRFQKSLKFSALIFFLLVWTGLLKAQYVSPYVVCYGEPIQLFCGGLNGCGQVGSTYTWMDESGSWMSNELNPVILPGSPGYHSGLFFLSVQYMPDGLSSGVAGAYLLSPFYVSGTVTPVTCNGAANGAIAITPEGGQPNYGPYVWSNGATTMNISGLNAGTYTVTVTDANFCTATRSFMITQPSGMTITKTGGSNVSCNGLSTGYIAVSTYGGTGPYAYAWSNGGTSPVISNLPAGAYTVTVSDINYCSKSQSWVVTQPAGMTVLIGGSNPSCYGGSNGIINTTVSGGTMPYSYTWSNGGGSTAGRTGLSAGLYSVTITDVNLCKSFSSYQLIQPSDITITGTTVNASCQGINSGQIITTVAGGSGGATTYLWSNNQTGSTAINLSAGVYTVTITNGAGCTKTRSFEVSSMTFGAVAINAATCNNSSNGSIQLFTGGGVTPYTYQWNNGQNTSTAVNLSAGVYSVTVTDAGSCAKAGSWQVTAPSAMVINSVVTNLSCFGNFNGKIDITVGGGSPGYLYRWNLLAYQGQGTAHVSALFAGPYTVTVTDNNLCTKVQSWLITQPVALSSNGTVTNVTCFGGSNGAASISGFGGTPPYSYKWSTGSNTQRITGLTVGRYYVTITDANTCFNQTWQNVTQPTDLTVTGTPVNVTCQGSNTGQITTTVSGGSGGSLIYLWNNGQSGSAAINLSAGVYTVTVTNAAGCTKTRSFIITTNPAIVFGSVNVIPAKCSGSNNGSIQLFVSGGISPYNYIWNNGQTTSAAINLTAGIYSVTVTDAASCNKTGSWQVTAPSEISIHGIQTNVLCHGNASGKIDITVAGGTPAYSYNWNVPYGQGQGTMHVSALSAGTYTVTVTDMNTCVKIQSWVITQPANLSSQGGVTNVSCYGGNNGIASTTASGGTFPYSYRWSTGSAMQRITGLTAGAYYVTITDANSCTLNAFYYITQPSEITVSGAIYNVTCQGGATGKIITTVTGGSGGTTSYLWSNNQTSPTANNLLAGTYTVTVTNAAGCTKSRSFLVAESVAKVITLIEKHNPHCNAGSDGSIQISVSGGLGSPYQYAWSNGQTASAAINLTAGVYTVTVTDAGSCPVNGSWSIIAPPALSISSVSGNVLCKNQPSGKIDITVTGGTPNYSYNWNVLGYQGQGTSHVSALAAGTYTVTVTDQNTCVRIQSWSITQPSALSGNGIVMNVTCYAGNNGAATITGFGGTSPYNYKWSTGSASQVITGLTAGRYYVTITDANTCINYTWQDVTQPTDITIAATVLNVMCQGSNTGQITTTVFGGSGVTTSYLWNNGQTGSTVNSLSAGSYTVTVTNGAGCTKTRSFAVTENPVITFGSVAISPPVCFNGNDGSIQLMPGGGVTPYTYLWNNGQSAAKAVNLAAGGYTVTITDAGMCSKVGSWQVTQPSDITIMGTPVKVTCQGSNTGQVTTTVTGGSGGTINYLWNNGQTGSTAINLTAGVYTVTVTNIAGCFKIKTFAVTENSAITLGSVTITPPQCFNGNNGSIQLLVSGGVSPYTYHWNNGQTTATAVNLIAGSYTVTVTDAGLCTKVGSWQVTQPAALSGNGVVGNVSCYGGNNGMATISGFGGTAPYSYKWITGSTAQVITGLTVGRYYVTVTDTKNCIHTTWQDITQPSDITITGISFNVTCQGGSTGQITTTVTGGSGGTTGYLWSNGQTAPYALNLTAGTYTVTVTNAAGCFRTKSFIVTENPAISFGSVVVIPAKCNNSNDGSIQLFTVGGVPPYSYLWNNGQTTPAAINLTSGFYTVTVTDAGLCTKVGSWLVTAPAAMSITGVKKDLSCSNNQTGKIDITVNGGNSAYSYLWNVYAYQGQGTAHVSSLAAGVYTVTVTDNNLCSKIQSWLITQPSSLSGNGSVTHVSCYGGNNGSVAITGFGGTAPYGYKWVTGSTAQQITGLTAGRYTVTITDANSCVNLTFQTITQPSDITITGTAVNATCSGSSNGYITTTVSGGSGGSWSYLWNNGQNSAIATNLTAGIYILTVTNPAGCQAQSMPFTVGVQNQPPGSAGAITGPAVVNQGQAGVAYSIVPILNATSYIWTLPPGATIVSGSNSPAITIDFSSAASSGVISVRGANECGNGLPSPDLDIVVIPLNFSLQNVTLGAGTYCYNAIQTIYVAGGSSTFIVNSGAFVTMIAGNNIIYLPGTSVKPGGYLHGYITTNGQYCTTPLNPIVNNPVQPVEVQALVPEILKSQLIRVYPNPANGSFTLDLTGTTETGMTKVEIFSMNGVNVISENLAGERKHVFNVEGLRPGMYFLHVTTGTTIQTVKFIKQ